MTKELFKTWISLNLIVKSKGIVQICDEFKKYLNSQNIKVDKDLELFIVGCLLELEDEFVIIKDENDKYIVNHDLLSKKQLGMIRKYRFKKFIKVLLIIMFLTIVVGSVFGYNYLQKEMELKKYNKEIKTINKVVLPIAKKYKVRDLQADSVSSFYDEIEISYKSRDFSKLNNKNKLLLLQDIYAKTYENKDIFDEKSDHYEDEINVIIINKGKKYKIGFYYDDAQLLVNNKEEYSLETDYAKELYKKDDSDESSSTETTTSTSTEHKRSICKGGVGCRTGFHACNPNKDGYCTSCCHSR